MNADSAYVIGAGHEVCQDYARTVVNSNGEALAVVSDGCSSSSDTDIGARLLVLARLEGGWGWTSRAHERCMLLGLSSCALDATLLEAAVEQGRGHVRMHGDGFAVVRTRGEATLDLYTVQYLNGFPDYPNYGWDPGRAAAFMVRSEGRRVTIQHSMPSSLFDWQHVSQFDEPRCELGMPYAFPVDVPSADLVAVMTDGFGSFTRKGPSGTEAVPVAEVVENLFKFKLYGGLFVKRRLKRFLKDARSWGWTHDDDLGIAAIYLGDDRA